MQRIAELNDSEEIFDGEYAKSNRLIRYDIYQYVYIS